MLFSVCFEMKPSVHNYGHQLLTYYINPILKQILCLLVLIKSRDFCELKNNINTVKRYQNYVTITSQKKAAMTILSVPCD